MSHEKFQNCIKECDSCAVACSHCATECLKEDQVKHLAKCIQLDMECAAICRSAAEIMSLGSYYSHLICQICADASNACAEECEKHAKTGMKHCRECAEACRQCAAACKEMMAAA